MAVKDALRSVNISSSLRPKDFKLKDNELPGPGTYEIGMTNLPKITLKGKIPTKIANENPGPGSYQLPLSVSPTVKIVNS